MGILAVVAWNERDPAILALERERDAAVAAKEQAEREAGVTEEMVEACKRLKNLVEGAPMRRWVDQNGERLKDQPEWVKFFNVLTDALRARTSAGGEG